MKMLLIIHISISNIEFVQSTDPNAPTGDGWHGIWYTQYSLIG